MTTRLDEFSSYRTRMNDRISQVEHLGIQRTFNLVTAAYQIPHLRHAIETIDLIHQEQLNGS